MNSEWKAWQENNPEIQGGAVACALEQSGGRGVVSLASFELLRISGDDALSFLQGQLSSDVRELAAGRAQFSSYSTAKGRMLASFLLWQHGADVYLLLKADQAEFVARRLSMFVLRAKVRVERLQGAHVLLGLCGKDALSAVGLPAQERMSVQVQDGKTLIALSSDRWLLVLAQESSLLPVGLDGYVRLAETYWAFLDVRAGIPWVEAATREQFVPQMANMELLGAVSFKKGCYPGQEIVARLQYLGKTKRRMHVFSAPQSMAAGMEVFSPQSAGQDVGMVVSAGVDETGAHHILAVVQSAYLEAGIYADAACQVPLKPEALPYALDVDVTQN